MKMIKIVLLLTCSIASGLVQANDLKYGSSNNHLFTKSSLADEISSLKQKEALLKAILKNTELIQLRDGSVIDFRDFESLMPAKTQIDTIKGLNEALMVREGGTGHGG